jgi:hypothetical protein
MPDPSVIALGRISGPLLSENLLRNGIDLAFNTDLLYLKVSPLIVGTSPSEDGDPNPTIGASGIGINSDNPIYNLDVGVPSTSPGTIKTTDLIVDNQLLVGDIYINGNSSFTTATSTPINISPGGIDPTIYYQRLTTAGIEFDDNFIATFGGQNLVLDPNGTGKVALYANTSITGNLDVSGNINIVGNLQSASTVYLGDKPFEDTITFAPDFTQSIIPGQNSTYDLGWPLDSGVAGPAEDSSARRWDFLYASELATVGTLNFTTGITVGDQMLINGATNTIRTLQSNDDLRLLPDTGITYLENLKFQGSDITNMLNTPLTITSTGIGYVRFMGNNGFVVPVGTDAERPASPELGTTRWNTDQDYLECWDGNVWNVSTGGGATVTQALMKEFSDIWALTLG